MAEIEALRVEIETLRRRVRNQTAALQMLASESAFVRVGSLQGSPFFTTREGDDSGPVLHSAPSHWYRRHEPLPPEKLTPGVARLVNTLRALGWETTDSGDGITNVAAGMEGALPFPHVVVQLHSNQDQRNAAWRMRHHIEAIATLEGVAIEATYSPLDSTSLLMVYYVDDSKLKESIDVEALLARDPDREVFCCSYAELNDRGDVVVAVNCNDTFAYACADAEDVSMDELYELTQVRYEGGWRAVVEWIAKRRKERGDPDCVPLHRRGELHATEINGSMCKGGEHV
jgi:hypothetical protein